MMDKGNKNTVLCETVEPNVVMEKVKNLSLKVEEKPKVRHFIKEVIYHYSLISRFFNYLSVVGVYKTLGLDLQ